MKENPNRVLVAPLNWGLGHVTRCIPIIKALENEGFLPILASDGMALSMLQKEFPHLQTLQLPSYGIVYPENGAYFKWKLLQSSFRILKSILKERRTIKAWIQKYQLKGIISDNRFGVYSSEIPSIYITHQLNVLTGNTTWISSKIHQFFIKKHTECWVPDIEKGLNLSGKLGHPKKQIQNTKYIGPISRLQKEVVATKYNLLILLSGPEPQRGLLEKQLRTEMENFDGKILFVRGVVESVQKTETIHNTTFYNYMNSLEIEKAVNESDLIVCRSGYTTIMDLAHLEKRAYFIPTPGQYEQEYLAKKFKKENTAPYSKQHKFKIEKLAKANLYRGFYNYKSEIDWKSLFSVFDK